jgi:hypothetical protein
MNVLNGCKNSVIVRRHKKYYRTSFSWYSAQDARMLITGSVDQVPHNILIFFIPFFAHVFYVFENHLTNNI